MARPQKLTRRDGTYYLRIHVPADLVTAMNGKKEFWRSLRTKDYNDAKRRELPERDQWSMIFDDMRRHRDLTPNDIAVAVWDHYKVGLEAGDKERSTRPTPAQINAANDTAILDAVRSGSVNSSFTAMINSMTDVELLIDKVSRGGVLNASRLRRLRNDLATGDLRLIEPAADAFIAKHRFHIDRNSSEYRDLCSKLVRAEIEHLQRTAERDKGDFTGKPADPIVIEPVYNLALPSEPEEGIMSLFERYEKENPGNVRAETLKQVRRDVQHFADFVGPRVRPSKISKANVRGWKELLAEWPVKAGETNAFKGLPIVEVVAENKKREHPKPTLPADRAPLHVEPRWFLRMARGQRLRSWQPCSRAFAVEGAADQ